MSRIIGGVARGRRLATPPGHGTRPTTDRVREALFGSLEAEFGGLGGVRFLDLYAGSGAVGLEALSRGATEVRLVESDRRAVAVIRRNLESLGDLSGARVSAVDVQRLVTGPPVGGPYDVVFGDPPYAVTAGALAGVLERLAAGGWLAESAMIVMERSVRGAAGADDRRAQAGDPIWPAGFAAVRDRRYGDTMLRYARFEPPLRVTRPAETSID